MEDSDKPNNEGLVLKQLKSIKVALWMLMTFIVILPVIAGIGTGVVIGIMALTSGEGDLGGGEDGAADWDTTEVVNAWPIEESSGGAPAKAAPATNKPIASPPEDVTSNLDPKLVAQGKVLFQAKICFTCHQTDPAVPAPAGLALKAPPFTGSFWGKEREVQLDADPNTPAYDPGGKIVKVKLDEAYFLESVEKPFAKIVKGAIPGMAPLPTTPEERKALAAYVKSLSK